MGRKRILFILLVLFAVGLCGCRSSDANVPDNVVAEYRGIQITKEVVQYNVDLYVFMSGGQVTPTEEEVLSQMLESTILLYESERLGLGATKEEIQAALDEAARMYENPYAKDQMDAYFQEYDLSLDTYLEMLKENQLPGTIARQKLRTAIGEEYCEKNGLRFENNSLPEEAQKAVDQYIEKLLKAERKHIKYYHQNP